MAAKLSDRIADASKDVFEKILKTEVVQKFYMTGDLNDRNRGAALKMYKFLIDLSPFSYRIFKEVAIISPCS